MRTGCRARLGSAGCGAWSRSWSPLPWVVWALVRTLGVELGYPLVALIAFTPYAALTSPVPVLVGLALRRRVVAGVAAVAALALGLAMVPRAIAGPQGEAAGRSSSVMTSNLYLGRADAGRSAADRARARRRRAERAGAAADADGRLERRAREQLPAPGRWMPDSARRAGGAGAAAAEVERHGRAGRGDARPARGRARRRGRAARTDQGRAPAPARRSARRRPPGERRWRRCRARTARRRAASSPATSTPRSTTPSSARCSTAATPTPRTPPAKGSHRPGPHCRARRALPLTIDHILVDRRVRVERVTVVPIPRTDHRAVIAVLRLPRR